MPLLQFPPHNISKTGERFSFSWGEKAGMRASVTTIFPSLADTTKLRMAAPDSGSPLAGRFVAVHKSEIEVDFRCSGAQ